jgi:predicted TIM-barrel fold metal-dependent hydrolase
MLILLAHLLLSLPGYALDRETFNLLSNPSELGKVASPLCNAESGCPGLPPVVDPNTPKPGDIISVDEISLRDALVHAECGPDLSSCKAMQLDMKLRNTEGGFIASRARVLGNNLEEALQADRRVADFVSARKGNFHGLCDPSFHKPFAVAEVTECMKMPGMIGVGELNINGDGSFSPTNTTQPSHIFLGAKAEGRKRFEDIAAAVQAAGGGTISTHLADSENPSSSEVDALIEIAAKYPKVTFIICHSGIFHGAGAKGFGLDGLKKIGKHFRDNPQLPQNIWTDLSSMAGNLMLENAFPDRCAFLARQAELAQAWRELGIHRVLFGTDGNILANGLESQEWTKKNVSGVLSNPYLSAADKKKIFSENFDQLVAGYKKR